MVDMGKTAEQMIVAKMRPKYMTLGDIADMYGISKPNCEHLVGKPCLRVSRGNRTRLWARDRVVGIMGKRG
jgi:hypothetical protein